MAKMNRIQFQPGMSLNLFLAHYGTQWVRDVLRDARQETNRAMRYDADLAVWCAVGILRRRGDLTAGGVLATYLARKLWYRVWGG